MPALPRTSINEPDRERTYVGFATRLPLTAHPAGRRGQLPSDPQRVAEKPGRELPLAWPASKERLA